MATLAGTTIANTFDSLLHVEDNTAGLVATSTDSRVIQDGVGANSALALATDSVRITSTNKLYFNDVGGEHIAGDGTDLTISSGNDIVFALGATGSIYHTGDGGTSNTIYGKNAGDSIASGGNYNVFIGEEAGTAITTGDENVALGYAALDANQTGGSNVAVGTSAASAFIGSYSVAIGREALRDANHASHADGTIAIGQGAGASITNGQYNTAIGYQALTTTTFGDKNVAVGYQAGKAYVPDENYGNCVFIGHQAGLNVSTARKATVIGNAAVGLGVMTGHENTVIGNEAGYDLTGGASNVIIGVEAGSNTTGGSSNVYIGAGAADVIVSGDGNVVVGKDAFGGVAGSDCNNNVAVGLDAMLGNGSSTGDANVGIGKGVMAAFTTAAENVAVGQDALASVTTAASNVAIGADALEYNVDGNSNVAIGRQACRQDGSSNNVTNADNCTFVGRDSRASSATPTNQTVLGYEADGVADNSVTLGNENVTTVYAAHDGGAVVHCGGAEVKRAGVNANLSTSRVITLNDTNGTLNNCIGLAMGTTNGTHPPTMIGQRCTSTSGSTSGEIYFATRVATTDAAPLQRMVIQDSGCVSIGTSGTGDVGDARGLVVEGAASQTSVKFQVRDTDTAVDTNNVIAQFAFTADADCTNGKFIEFADSGGIIGSVTSDGGGIDFNDTSDYRTKTDLKDIVDATKTIDKLKLYDFAWKNNTDNRSIGVIAHEAQEVFPMAITGVKDAMTTMMSPDENGDLIEKEVIAPQQVSYMKFVPLLLKAVQELSAKVKALEDA